MGINDSPVKNAISLYIARCVNRIFAICSHPTKAKWPSLVVATVIEIFHELNRVPLKEKITMAHRQGHSRLRNVRKPTKCWAALGLAMGLCYVKARRRLPEDPSSIIMSQNLFAIVMIIALR
jgi:hypothetical protein